MLPKQRLIDAERKLFKQEQLKVFFNLKMIFFILIIF